MQEKVQEINKKKNMSADLLWSKSLLNEYEKLCVASIFLH